jgi:quercetin dioxygenase-like cupin family protein
MIWKPIQIIAVVSVLFIASCSKPGSDATSTPQPVDEATPAAMSSPGPVAAEEGGSDPTIVDADHYKTEFENDAVRIVRIAYGAGEESVMHYHPDSVAVFVTDQLVQMTMSDGSTEEFPAKAGDATFTPGGQHLPKNNSDSTLELVLVELKSRESAKVEPSGPHATDVDPDHYTPEFENDAVRIVRIAYGAGEESVMHYHPDSVAVFLTDHLVEMTMPDGSTEEISAKAGDAIFIPGGQHLPKNISDEAWEVVLIELK